MRINQLRVVAACRSTSLLATSTGEPIVTSYDTSPWQVQLALLLLAANLILGFVRMAIQQGWTHPEKAAMGLMLVGTVSVYWLYGLAIRLNWLRWWTLVSTLLGVPLTGYAIYQIQTPWVAGRRCLRLVLAVGASALLFSSSGRVWHTRRVGV